ncbi:MAG: DUF4407 domain-containing protein [Lewinellaceae bacterium]|nr:DUF4407 domain-containing protein [Phaeodactylibacter sp.]MCB9038164.1 DUF4407 domain-containing protein [Lewinellaceae bacterium]
MSFLSRFFITCSGANKRIIEEIPPSYRGTELTKFVGIGGAIFFTSFLAFISASFATSTFVKSLQVGSVTIPAIFICMAFGVVWAFMIFNLDRYIVSSMRKIGDWKKELLHASPRIFLALLFAFVISKPLEMEIFRTEIEVQLPESAEAQTIFLEEKIDSLAKENRQLKQEADTLRKDPYNSEFIKSAEFLKVEAKKELDSLKNELSPRVRKLMNNIQQFQNQRSAAYRDSGIKRNLLKQLRRELENDPDNLNNGNKKRQIKELERDIYRLKIQIENIDKSLPGLKEDLEVYQRRLAGGEESFHERDSILQFEKGSIGAIVKERIGKNGETIARNKDEIEKLKAKRNMLNESFTGLLARLKALEDLKRKEENEVIWWASTLIFLLFVAIETAPIFVKLISNETLYDQLLAEYEKPLSNKDLIQTKMSGFFEIDSYYLSKEKETLRKFYDDKARLKEEYLQKSLGHIRELEKKKFESNKDEYAEKLFNAPGEYMNASPAPTLHREGNKLYWSDEGLFEEPSSVFTLKRAVIAAGIMGMITATAFGTSYFLSDDGQQVRGEMANDKLIGQKNEAAPAPMSAPDVIDGATVGSGQEDSNAFLKESSEAEVSFDIPKASPQKNAPKLQRDERGGSRVPQKESTKRTPSTLLEREVAEPDTAISEREEEKIDEPATATPPDSMPFSPVEEKPSEELPRPAPTIPDTLKSLPQKIEPVTLPQRDTIPEEQLPEEKKDEK